MTEACKILPNMYNADCSNSLFEFKESNKCGHQFAVNSTCGQNYLHKNF